MNRKLITPGILIFLAIIIAMAILLLMADATKPKPSVVNNGPLDIRLVGVCPNGGEQLYDAGGRKLKATMGALGAFHTHWKDEDQCWDFLFEITDVNNQLLFLPSPRICPVGMNRGLGGGILYYFDPTDNPSTLIYSITFDRTYRKKLLFFKFNEAIQYIDLTLRYLYGPRGQSTCTFTGPFTMNQTVEAEGAKPYYLTFQEGITLDGSGIVLRFETSESFDRDAPAIVYDLNGRRYMLDDAHGSRSGGKTELQYGGVVVSPEKIAAITFGEKPHEITFKNIAVDYTDQPYRTYPEFLDRMSKRLGLVDMSPEELAQYKFKNPAEAIEVIDIIRGDWYVRQVFEAIRHGKSKIDITKLDQATQDKIHRAATEWAKTNHLAKYGISLGLMGRWPEFFDMAIDRLGKDYPADPTHYRYERTWRSDNHDVAYALQRYYRIIEAHHVDKIKQLILRTDNGTVLGYLFRCLGSTQSQAVTDAFWELAQDDRPWIWWRATEVWYSRESRIRNVYQDMYDDLSEKMKLRVILIVDNIRDENLQSKASGLLSDMFTPKLGRMASDIWNTVREGITSDFDKKVATDIYINYLRQMQIEMTGSQWVTNDIYKHSSKWTVASIIRTLNVWYGTNIGKLGTDETVDTDIYTLIRTQIEFQALITEALEWYDSNKNVTPVEQRSG